MTEDMVILTAAKCVYNWLGYLSKASENCGLLAESALKYPFVESLERHQVNDIHLEINHPLFKKRRIDAFIGGRNDYGNTVDDSSEQKIFIEFKFVRENTLSENEKERFFADLLRLSCLKKRYPSAKCFFMVCGMLTDFISSFRFDTSPTKSKGKGIETEIIIKEKNTGKRRGTRKSIYQDWLSFNPKRPEKAPDLFIPKYKKYTKFFEDEYLTKMRDGIPKINRKDLSLNTLLWSLMPEVDNRDNAYGLGLWEIVLPKDTPVGTGGTNETHKEIIIQPDHQESKTMTFIQITDEKHDVVYERKKKMDYEN